ncbi:MAG: Ig-like domain-containing protein, partial [Acidobacteria bacterium]|nr:Ig-like domain-containing protein [Acidobacteriota bacterium]
VALSGRWSGIDPATLAAAGSAASAEIVHLGDDAGSFLFRDLPLAPGDNTLTISGRDILGRLATASVAVRRDDAAPSIEISAPRDHAIFGMNAPALEISGTASAANGATIEVGGQPATIVSTEAISEMRTRYAFTASASFATVGPTPVVARVTDPEGRSAYHAIRVTKLSAAPKVAQVFPDAQAIGVDPGAMIVVLFSNPMDRASLRCGAGEGCAFRLETPSGSAVSGLLDLDEDALTFAPAAPLEDGAARAIVEATAASSARSLIDSLVALARSTGAVKPIVNVLTVRSKVAEETSRPPQSTRTQEYAAADVAPSAASVLARTRR